MSKIFVLYGPSASGKSEIQKELTSSGLPKIITATTRPPRQNEQDGVHYIFMNTLQFETRLSANHFIEWTRYNGQYYGTLKSSIDELMYKNSNSHIVLDLTGVLALKKIYPNTVAIYVGANIETLKRRLEARGGEPNEIMKRVKQAEEVELSSHYIQHADVVVWNHDGIDFADTLMKIKKIIAQL